MNHPSGTPDTDKLGKFTSSMDNFLSEITSNTQKIEAYSKRISRSKQQKELTSQIIKINTNVSHKPDEIKINI